MPRTRERGGANGNGWNVNKLWVKQKISDHDDRIGSLETWRFQTEDWRRESAVEMGKLAVKIGLWAAVPGLVTLLGYLLLRAASRG